VYFDAPAREESFGSEPALGSQEEIWKRYSGELEEQRFQVWTCERRASALATVPTYVYLTKICVVF